MPQVNIDGRWHDLSHGRLGLLGQRYTVTLSDKKILLVRLCESPSGRLEKRSVASDHLAGLRRVSEADRYQCRLDEKTQPYAALLLHQDISGVEPFAEAIHKAAKDAPLDIWKFLGRGCRTLKALGEASPATRVPLQCPQSLGVDHKDRVLLLDAEFTVGNLHEATETAKFFEIWYGRTTGFTDRATASRQHARALLAYILKLLSKPGTSEVERIKAQLGQLLQEPQLDLDEVERFIKEESGLGLFDLEIDESSQEEPLQGNETKGESPVPTKRSPLRQVSFSWWLVLLLSILVIVLWSRKTITGRTGENPVPPPDSTSPRDEDAAFLSNYCVVFPEEGTERAKVKELLQQLFENRKIIEFLGGDAERSRSERTKLLEMQSKETLGSLKKRGDPRRLREILLELAQRQNIHCLGFVPDNGDQGLTAIFEERGRFSMKDGPKDQFSLLQGNGVSTLVSRGSLAEADQALLVQLRDATVEYVSLHDALEYIGTRSAFLVPVEPTEKAHKAARHLLSRETGQQIFVSRLRPLVFDGIKTAAGKVEDGDSSLEPQIECYFRVVSESDRSGMNFRANTSNTKMYWVHNDKNKRITWNQLPIRRTNRDSKKPDTTTYVASFDIAVVLNDKSVVVFRNQDILRGDQESQITDLARAHLRDVLQLEVANLKSAVLSFRLPEPKKGWVGALRYSYLAEKVTEKSAEKNPNIKWLVSKQEFEKSVLVPENAQLSPP